MRRHQQFRESPSAWLGERSGKRAPRSPPASRFCLMSFLLLHEWFVGFGLASATEAAAPPSRVVTSHRGWPKPTTLTRSVISASHPLWCQGLARMCTNTVEFDHFHISHRILERAHAPQNQNFCTAFRPQLTAPLQTAEAHLGCPHFSITYEAAATRNYGLIQAPLAKSSRQPRPEISLANSSSTTCCEKMKES